MDKNSKMLMISAVLIVIIAGFYAFNDFIYQQKQATYQPGETVVASGKVLAVDTSQAAVDGPVELTLQANDGTLYTISIPTMGLLACKGAENIDSGFGLAKNDNIEVKGIMSNKGNLVPCESEDHYLRKTL